MKGISMQKKAQLAKWSGVMILLLGVAAIAILGSPHAAKADSTQETCKLVKSEQGSIPLHTDPGMDPGLDKTLMAYSVQCSPTTMASCNLVPISSTQNATLDKTVTNEELNWIYKQLDNTYGLMCYANDADNPVMNGPIKLICKLAWPGSNAINTPLDKSQVTDRELVASIQDTGLQCFPSGEASCNLVPISATQNATLEISYLNKDATSWIYSRLSGHYGLECRAAV
jgi:hypothetical protein